MKMKYTVLENGLDFILMSVNDLLRVEADDMTDSMKKSLIKYALLHLSSGIELVLKHKLLQEHWTYVFADMNKAKKEALQSGEFKSVDSETIIERLENFCEVTLTDSEKKELRNLRKRRNKAEHFNLNENILSTESSIHKCMSILIKVIVENYNIEDFTNEETDLLAQIKLKLRDSQEHYNDVKSIAQKELEQTGLQEYAITCPDCEEIFLLRDDGVKCYLCNYEATAEKAADDYIANVLGVCSYTVGKEGGEYPLYECPSCGTECLVLEEDKVLCFNCDFDEQFSNVSFCNDCGRIYTCYNKEDNIGICSECIEYRMSKD